MQLRNLLKRSCKNSCSLFLCFRLSEILNYLNELGKCSLCINSLGTILFFRARNIFPLISRAGKIALIQRHVTTNRPNTVRISAYDMTIYELFLSEESSLPSFVGKTQFIHKLHDFLDRYGGCSECIFIY